MEKETDDQRENLVGRVRRNFLTSCTANQPLSSGLATSTITKQPILPTITPKISTTQTSQPTVEAEVIFPLEEIVFGDCLEVQPNLPEDVNIPWDLIGGGRKNQKIILDINSGEIIPLKYFEEVRPNGLRVRWGDIKVSPDGKWIAYVGSYDQENKLFVDSTLDIADMTEENSVGLEIEKPFRLKRWVDADTLLLQYEDPDAPYLYFTSFFDPISGEEHIFSIRDLPNYLDEDLGGAFIDTHYWVDGDLVPDPTMTRIVYPSIIHETYDIKNNLWDVKEEKLITQFRFFVQMENQPFWALDGSDFLMATFLEKGKKVWFNEWFIMSRDGDYRQITNFIEFMENNDYYFDDIGRSPDGRYLAFRIDYGSGENRKAKYIILNIKNSELSSFCINALDSYWMDMPVPWSPDSRYIVVNIRDDNYSDTKGDSTLIVDVEKRTAYKITEEIYALGWIERNP